MKLNLDKINPNQIKGYNKEDFTIAFSSINKKSSEIKKLKNNIRKLILGIVILCDELNINKNSSSLSNELINSLESSEKLHHIGIGKIISNILNPEDNSFDELDQFSNELKFKWDVKEGWAVKNVSKNLYNILGYDSVDFYSGKIKFSEIIHKDDIGKITKEVEDYSSEKSDHFTQEYRIKKENGDYIVIKDYTKVKYDSNGKIEYFYGYITDITKQKKIENELKEKNLIDGETLLPNEKQLKIDLNIINGEKMVIILKINNFKHINSFYGYEGGSNILLNIANRLEDQFGNIGFKLYKISQLNFGLLKNCDGKPESKFLTIKMINNILSNFSIDSIYGNINIKLSAGSACRDKASIDNALSALYSSSNSGKLISYTPELQEKFKNESGNILKWSEKIKEGLEKNYFIPFYQGIYNNKTGEIDKYEALVRFDDGKNVESPWQFLKIAEKINLLGDISKKMIETVISEMRNHKFCISINLTENDFNNNMLIKIIIDNLEYYGITPNRLTVEVLENITGDLDDTIINNIEKLKKQGIKISIDDFGTGHSNFARLTEISPDYLKIDGSLVKGIDNKIKNNIYKNLRKENRYNLNIKEKKEIIKEEKEINKHINILRTIIKFGHIHGSKIIAEFVENKEIQKTIKLLGIDYSQGYYYSKPSRNIIKK